MPAREIPAEAAWRNVIESRTSHWKVPESDPHVAESAHGRLEHGIALPHVRPLFELRETDAFFCIGSCFARNIEEHLMYRGIAVPSRAIAFEGRTGRPNSRVNKFTTASILNELRWSLAGEPFSDAAFVQDRDGWRDLQLSPGAAPLPLEQVRARRAAVTEYFRGIRNANVVILTLGLTEVWHDSEASVDLNVAPSFWTTRQQPGRFRVRVTDYAENVATLCEVYDMLGRYAAPGVRIVVTVSPVPMSQTFTGDDVIVANTHAKSTLRAAAADSARGRAGVQYYPSYDAITVSHRSAAYSRADHVHVRDDAVEAVTAHFLRTYGIARERPHPEFVEMEYLMANPDVDDAVRQLAFPSGYAHWLEHGRHDGRPLRAQQRSALLDELLGT